MVENVGGAGGTIGALRAARAAADGYTILSGHLGTNALAPAFYPNLGYDPQKDFEPIGLTAEYPELLVVRKDFPANNFKEFVAYAKSNADKLNVGHAGLGSVSYIGCLLLNAAIGIKPTMVPFTGTAPVLNAMLAARSTMNAIPVLGTLSQVRAGNVKALAVAAKKRSPMLPDVPTSHEQGLPEFDMRAVLCGVRAERHAAAGHRETRGRLEQRVSPRRPCKSGWPNSAPIAWSRSAAGQRRSPTWSKAKPRG